jgi:hypothetical protein
MGRMKDLEIEMLESLVEYVKLGLLQVFDVYGKPLYVEEVENFLEKGTLLSLIQFGKVRLGYEFRE